MGQNTKHNINGPGWTGKTLQIGTKVIQINSFIILLLIILIKAIFTAQVA